MRPTQTIRQKWIATPTGAPLKRSTHSSSESARLRTTCNRSPVLKRHQPSNMGTPPNPMNSKGLTTNLTVTRNPSSPSESRKSQASSSTRQMYIGKSTSTSRTMSGSKNSNNRLRWNSVIRMGRFRKRRHSTIICSLTPSCSPSSGTISRKSK